MKQSANNKKIYAPYVDGKRILCSRCFDSLADIVKYGHDDEGYWFIAPCRSCKAKMKWYRTKNGMPQVKTEQKEDATFGLSMVDGELTLVTEE